MHTTRWHWLSRLALVVAIGAVALLGLSGPGYRLGWISVGTALQRMMPWAAFGGLAAAALALVGMVLSRRQRGARLAGVAALVIGLASAYVPWQFQRSARAVPAIHDISTDTITPPTYVEAAAIRTAAGANSLAYLDEVAAKQREAYPDIAPLFLPVTPDQAYQKALGLVRSRGWTLVATDETGRRIEATDSTLVFGFKDDIAVRVSAIPDNSSRIDVRSVSRVGRSDIGVNARRIRAFLADLSK